MNEKVELLMERLDVTRKGAERIANIVETGVDILRTEGFTALTKRRIAFCILGLRRRTTCLCRGSQPVAIQELNAGR